MNSSQRQLSDTRKRHLFELRIFMILGLLFCSLLVIIGRLIELQIVKGSEYRAQAEEQQYRGVVLSAQRGEILSRSSKSDDTSILATNTTETLLYIDPLTLNNNHAEVADELAHILLTPTLDAECREGKASCPSEFTQLYEAAFDPLKKVKIIEEYTASGTILRLETGSLLASSGMSLFPDITEIRRQFARSIEKRIKDRSVTYAPLMYGANKKQLSEIASLQIPGMNVDTKQALIYANPDAIPQERLTEISRVLAPILNVDPASLHRKMVRRPLRYVPIMAHVSTDIADIIQARKEASLKAAQKVAEAERAAGKKNVKIDDPFRAVALVPGHRRYYPDSVIGSHLIGFINALGEPQYGIERTFDSLLRGQEGLIASVKDRAGVQIVSSDETFVDPLDGATVVLTIDRIIQQKVEQLLDAMVKKIDAESGQVIIMDPHTGRILAMANAPLFDSNTYAAVYEKEPMIIPEEKENQVVVEIMNPESNTRVLRAYLPDITPEGRLRLQGDPERCLEACIAGLKKFDELLTLYELPAITRYYYYLGDNNRREIFPTEHRGVWLKYKNNIGVGSYVNRTIQEVYEPGSVMKPITMAIAIDQGEVSPQDTYTDSGSVKIDKFIIKNALNAIYNKVTMVDCIDFSINTCMTSVSAKLGRKLFQSALAKFGFGKVTGIELDNELPGNLKPWRSWDPALVLTTAFGQGISTTPLQMVSAFSALANGGKIMKPTIVDEIRHSDGHTDHKQPEIIEQAMKPETAQTMTAMLTHSAQFGFAKAGKPKNYRVAGKTGTSQIAGPGGKYESGTGATIATYAGFAPVEHPRFVILVKLDRPKKDDFGSKSAAPLFKDIASFLFDYYDIPPDEK